MRAFRRQRYDDNDTDGRPLLQRHVTDRLHAERRCDVWSVEGGGTALACRPGEGGGSVPIIMYA